MSVAPFNSRAADAMSLPDARIAGTFVTDVHARDTRLRLLKRQVAREDQDRAALPGTTVLLGRLES